MDESWIKVCQIKFNVECAIKNRSNEINDYGSTLSFSNEVLDIFKRDFFKSRDALRVIFKSAKSVLNAIRLQDKGECNLFLCLCAFV